MHLTLPAAQRAVFISDLHLGNDTPRLLQAFAQFLDEQIRANDALFILGDLLEAHCGDDDDSAVFRKVKELLALQTRNKNVALYFMHGNRDFIAGQIFCNAVGATLLPDPTVLIQKSSLNHNLSVPEVRILLSHGDAWCTDDVAYQQFRQASRQAAWQAAFLSKPLPERQAIVAQYQTQSVAAKAMKAQAIMDVNPAAVMAALVADDCSIALHGHTHRAGETFLPNNARRVVLGDWREDEPIRYAVMQAGMLTLF